MRFTQRARGIVQTVAVILSLALPLAMAASSADARVGGGVSSGSRGGRTFSAPPSTSTAPNTAQPFNRTITQPGTPGLGTQSGGFFNRPGTGLLGGLAAGFLGAGLLGLLLGGGMFGGIGGLSSIIGLMLQIGLIILLVRFAMSWWQRRHETAAAFAGGPSGLGAQSSFRNATGFGLGGSGNTPLEILPSDYEAFERLLSETQAAWSDEDIARLHTLATPEMVSYLAHDIERNKARNVINKVSGTKLLQGDLAEAWREGNTDYATVAMRFSMVDKTVDRATGRLVEGSEQPTEVTEVWTFLRPRGSNWELSAIQQT
jgi:predicted lipid-binding transport protein (Tim44 family)